MPAHQPAKLMRLHLSEHDRYKGKPLYEAILEKCRDLKIAGATAFRGLEGYGETAEIHRRHLLGHDLPIVVNIGLCRKHRATLPSLGADDGHRLDCGLGRRDPASSEEAGGKKC